MTEDRERIEIGELESLRYLDGGVRSGIGRAGRVIGVGLSGATVGLAGLEVRRRVDDVSGSRLLGGRVTHAGELVLDLVLQRRGKPNGKDSHAHTPLEHPLLQLLLVPIAGHVRGEVLANILPGVVHAIEDFTL